jgi:hypothetical protein
VRQSYGHAVDDPNCATARLELGFENQCRRPIAARSGHDVLRRRDVPSTVRLGPEQLRETRGGIESRQAQPVDRTVEADQRRSVHVADQSIVFDAESHPFPLLQQSEV